MKEISLVNSALVALVDDEDYDELSSYRWYVLACPNNKNYASTVFKGKHILMHHMIIGRNGILDVDHEDNNGLNNQRANLQFMSRSANQRKSNNIKGTVKIRGVHYNKKLGKYVAQIRVNYVSKYLGVFNTAEEAGNVYEEHRKKYLDAET